MDAKVTTYGGGVTVQHWQLEVDGQFIADTSIRSVADLFAAIAARCDDGGQPDKAVNRPTVGRV